MKYEHCGLSLLVFLSFLLLVTSCTKNTDNGGTFTVTGQWLKDCNGRAHANESIEFTIVSNNNSATFEHVGNGSTDDNGNFSIACENHGSGRIYLTQDAAKSGNGGFNITGGDGGVDAIGTFYDQFTESAIIRFVFANANTDTFYAGNEATPEFTIYPATGSQTITRSRVLSGIPDRLFDVKWGLGINMYKQALSGAITKHEIQLSDVYKVCGQPETTRVNIPFP